MLQYQRLGGVKRIQTQQSRSLSSSPPLDLLPICSALKSLRHVQQLHAAAISGGLLPRSVSLCAALLLRYASISPAPSSALRRLFAASVPFCRTAFLFNTLFRASSLAGDRRGIGDYNRMVRTGLVSPDDHTFPFVLKLCADFSEPRKGLEVHGCVFKLGFETDVYVANTLVAFYGRFGDLVGARKVFDEMPERDVVSWNTLFGLLSVNGFCAEAIGCYREMCSSSVRPSCASVVSVLPACVGVEDEGFASEVHCYAVKVGLDLEVSVGNALVDVYGKCGNVKASKRVFDGMVCRNEVSWNSAITSLSYIGRDVEALDVFRSMVDSGVSPNSVTISHIVPILVGLGLFRVAKEIHTFSIRMSIDSDTFTCNSLIDMYSKSGCSKAATNVFDNMVERNIVSWNAMVSNFAQNGLEFEAIELVRQMQARGENPNSITFTNVLPACSRLGSLCPGKEIHARVIRVGPASDLFVSNALSDMYAKCSCLSYSQNVFNVSPRDEVSYNILIVGYSQSNDCSKSLSLFSEMRLLGMKPDVVSFMGVISACANLGVIKHGKEVHGLLIRKHFHTHLFISNSLVDFYVKCGRINLARKVFDRIPSKDVTSWNAMIMGYGMVGEIEKAISLFEAMKKEENVEYDSVSYVAVLSACSHGGLVEKGKKYFHQMKVKSIEPTQTHYACMVDLLGRAGLMEEASELIRELPCAPDANVWGALLGACRIHGNVEMGAWAAEHLFRLKPRHSGYYVLLSNMYSEAGRWSEANRVRELMKSRGVKKGLGCSWVQIGNRVHAFGVGERVEDFDSAIWNG